MGHYKTLETRHLCFGAKYENKNNHCRNVPTLHLTFLDDSIALTLIGRLYRLLIESIMFVSTFPSNCDTEDDGWGKEDDPIEDAK